jgi:hypothetical protein
MILGDVFCGFKFDGHEFIFNFFVYKIEYWAKALLLVMVLVTAPCIAAWFFAI